MFNATTEGKKMNRTSLTDLRSMLVSAECRAVCDPDFIVRMTAREDVRKLKARIARRERDQAMRDVGMVKTAYGWE